MDLGCKVDKDTHVCIVDKSFYIDLIRSFYIEHCDPEIKNTVGLTCLFWESLQESVLDDNCKIDIVTTEETITDVIKELKKIDPKFEGSLIIEFAHSLTRVIRIDEKNQISQTVAILQYYEENKKYFRNLVILDNSERPEYKDKDFLNASAILIKKIFGKEIKKEKS